MKRLKIKTETDVKKLLALVGESCDNSIMAFNIIEKMITDEGGRLSSSRLATFYVKCRDKDFPCSFHILGKDNKDNKCGEKALQITIGEKAAQIPMVSNNIDNPKDTVLEYAQLFVTDSLKEYNELEIDVDVVGE